MHRVRRMLGFMGRGVIRLHLDCEQRSHSRTLGMFVEGAAYPSLPPPWLLRHVHGGETQVSECKTSDKQHNVSSPAPPHTQPSPTHTALACEAWGGGGPVSPRATSLSSELPTSGFSRHYQQLSSLAPCFIPHTVSQRVLATC